MAKYEIKRGDGQVLMSMARFGCPEIRMFGRNNFARAREGLRPHVHPGEMEICYLKKGERVYNVKGQDYPMHGNDVFVTFPGERHGSGKNPHGRGYLYWLQVALPRKPRHFLGLSPAMARPLVKALWRLPCRHFYTEEKISDLFDEVFRLVGDSAEPLRNVLIANSIQQILALVVQGAESGPPRRFTGDILRVVRLMEEKLEEPCSLEEMARTAGLSVSRFKAKFKAQAGIPPGEYLVRRRVEAARNLLATTDRTITEIAHDLGFSSSQYFATVFKRYTNVRPRDARASGGGGRT